MEIETRQDELYHYGRLGMKWGKCIFGRDKTGSKQRKSSRAEQSDNNGSSGTGGRKSLNDVSIDELRKNTDRLTAEKNYFDAERSRAESYNKLYPKSDQKTKESFAKAFINDAVKPAVISAGKNQIERYLNTEIEKLTKGKVDPDSIEYLKKKSEKQGFKTKIAENTQKMMEANRKIKQYQEEDKIAKEAEKRRAEAERQVDNNNRNRNNNATDSRTVYDGQRYVEQLLLLEDRHGR